MAVAHDNVEFPNGIAVTPDGETLLVAESTAGRISAFDVAADGSLRSKRRWADVGGFVDGICLDAEGCLWVANHARAQFVRVCEGGEVTGCVAVPGRWALACALGGPGGTTLYMATSE